MPSWNNLVDEINTLDPSQQITTIARKKINFLQQLSLLTNRNIILYYSGFLQKPSSLDTSINDKDLNAFMNAVYNLEKTKGLDLILHTPGGDLAATEQIIHYLHQIFDGDIRTIVPQLAMSAGSLISVSTHEIIMGKQSCLGPFDPQLNGVPCQSVIKEFDNAIKQIKDCPSSLGLWQVILGKLTPTFITSCYQAQQLCEELTESILTNSKLSEEEKKQVKKVFTDNQDSKTHSRHIDREKCKKAGLNIKELESDQNFQDLVLSIHHCCMILFEKTNIVKIVENQHGAAHICSLSMPQPPPSGTN